MKKQSITLLLSIFVVSIINAQDIFFLEEQLIQLEDTRFSAWVFPVAHDLDFALEDLQAYCKDRSDVKLKKDGENIILGEKLSIPGISTKRGDLIGKGFITETNYSVALIFKLGYDISLNSVIWEQEMKNFRSYAREFMSYHFEKAFARRIDGVEKQISDLDKKISKETDETKIAESKTEISVLEDNIAGLTNTTTQLQDQIDSLKEDVLDINAELHTVQENIGSL